MGRPAARRATGSTAQKARPGIGRAFGTSAASRKVITRFAKDAAPGRQPTTVTDRHAQVFTDTVVRLSAWLPETGPCAGKVLPGRDSDLLVVYIS